MYNCSYDWGRELDAYAQKELRRLTNTKPLNSKQAWNWNSSGSAECASSSWASILDAYGEYKSSKDW